jgi:hypothetical protein
MSSPSPAPDSGRRKIWSAILILTLLAAILYLATVKACSGWQGNVQAPIIAAHTKHRAHPALPAVSTAPAAQPLILPGEEAPVDSSMLILKPAAMAVEPVTPPAVKPAPKPPPVAKAALAKPRKKKHIARAEPHKAAVPAAKPAAKPAPSPSAHGDQLVIEWQNGAQTSTSTAAAEAHKLLIEWQKDEKSPSEDLPTTP